MKLLGLDAGRFNRSTFILSSIVSMFVFVSIGVIIGEVFGIKTSTGGEQSYPLVLPLGVLWWIYHSLCAIRRFHDLDMNGWWLVSYFVPFLNFIIGLRLVFESGSNGANKYGERPKTTSIMGFVVRRKTPLRSKNT